MHALLHPLSHQPHSGADLVVGIAGAHDPGRARRLDGVDLRNGDARPRMRRQDRPVRIRVTRQTDVHQQPAARGEHLHEFGLARGEISQQVNDHRPDLRGGTGTKRTGGGEEQILLVVPGTGESLPDGAVDAHNVGCADRARGDRVESGIRNGAQLAVRRDERLLGRWVVGDRSEHTRRLIEHGAHGGGDHRRGHRPAPRSGEHGGTEPLGQAMQRHERDVRDAARPRRQRPARGDGHVVRRDHDGDRREPVAALELRGLSRQQLHRSAPVGGRRRFDRHVS